MKAILLICIPTIICLALISGTVRAQQPDDQIKRVFADWEKRREACSRIRYKVTGQNTRPKGSLKEDFMGRALAQPEPAKDVILRRDATVLLDIAHNRFRFELVADGYNSTGNHIVPDIRNFVFDGQSFAVEIPREAYENAGFPRQSTAPDVDIHRNYSQHRPLMWVNAYFLSPLYTAHGFLQRWSETGDFKERPNAEDFMVYGHHFSNGRDCLVLRTFPDRTGGFPSFDEFWIDTGRDSAIVHQASFHNEKVIVSIDVTFQQTAQGWLPLQWTGTTHDDRGMQLISETHLQVQHIDAEPPVEDRDFEAVIKPGMYLMETTHDSPMESESKLVHKIYHVSSNGRWNEVVNGVEYEGHSLLWRVGGGVLAVVALVALGYWFFRKKGKISTMRSP